MVRYIFKKFGLGLTVFLLGCGVPVQFADSEGAQNCTQAQIQVNIAKFKDGKNYHDGSTSPAFNAVVECGSESIKPLIQLLSDRKAAVEVRRKSAGALLRIGNKVSEADVQAVVAVVADKTDNPEVRRDAAVALLPIGNISESHVKAVIAVVSDKTDNPGVRSNAGYALWNLGKASESDIKALVAVVADKTDNPGVRRDAADALGWIGKASESDVKAVVAVVANKTDNPEVRSKAVYALERIAFNLVQEKNNLSTEQLEKVIQPLTQALEAATSFEPYQQQIDNFRSHVQALKEERQSR